MAGVKKNPLTSFPRMLPFCEELNFVNVEVLMSYTAPGKSGNLLEGYALNSNLSDLSHPEFILKLATIADFMEVHDIFKVVPEYISGFASYREMSQQYKAGVDSAASGGKASRADRDAMRAEFQLRVDFTAQHMTMVAYHMKDPNILHNTGLDFKHRKPIVRTPVFVPGIPTIVSAKRGVEPRTAVLMVKKPKGTASIEVQFSTGDPRDETSWQDGGGHVTARIIIRDLEALKETHFRVRFRTAGGVSGWSQVVSEVIL
jgi:hypothetical protein